MNDQTSNISNNNIKQIKNEGQNIESKINMQTSSEKEDKAERGEGQDDEGYNPNNNDGDSLSSSLPPPSPPETKQVSLTKVLSMAKPEIPMMIVSFILLAGSEACNLIIPMIVANAYDALIYRTEDESTSDIMSSINRIMITVIGIYIGGMVIGFLRTLIMGIIGERLVARLRCQLYASILRQEIAFFDEHKTGELVSRLGSDTTLLQTVISFSIPEVAVGFIKAVTAIVLMFIISAKLAALSLGGVIVIFLFAIPIGKKLGVLSKDYQDELGQAQTHSTEAFGSMRTVQSFAAEKKEMARFERKIGNPDNYPFCPNLWFPTMHEGDVRSTYRVGFYKSLINSGFYTLIFGAGFGFLNVSLWYGFYLINNGELSIGQLTAFQTYVFNIGFGLGQVGGNAAKVIEGLGANGRVFYLLDRIPKIPKMIASTSDNGSGGGGSEKKVVEKALKPTFMKGDIEFNHVNFSYPSRPGTLILNDFTLKIPSRSTTGMY